MCDLIDVNKIKVNYDDNVRLDLEWEKIAVSLLRVGPMEPVIVSVLLDDPKYSFKLICGYRRIMAFTELGWYRIPAIVLTAEGEHYA